MKCISKDPKEDDRIFKQGFIISQPKIQNIDLVKPTNLTLEQIQTWFPNPNGIKFKFCGVLGDPIVNPQCMEITKYLVDNGGEIQYSTNGGPVSYTHLRAHET